MSLRYPQEAKKHSNGGHSWPKLSYGQIWLVKGRMMIKLDWLSVETEYECLDCVAKYLVLEGGPIYRWH